MIINVKTIKKLFAMMCLVALILYNNLSWAGGTVFSGYFIRDLKVMEVNVENVTVTLRSPDGKITTLTVGDVIGQEAFTISAINKDVIEIESPPDRLGKTIKSSISAIRIDTLEDCTYIEAKPAYKKK